MKFIRDIDNALYWLEDHFGPVNVFLPLLGLFLASVATLIAVLAYQL